LFLCQLADDHWKTNKQGLMKVATHSQGLIKLGGNR